MPAAITPVILIVDDDQGDQVLIREGLQAGGIPKKVHVVCDGAEALEYLFQRGRYAPPAEAPRPNLIVLDLDMPRVNGKEVLARVKQEAGLRQIPVVIFTTSGLEEDIRFCYAAGANAYVRKAGDFDQLRTILSSMEVCWLGVLC